MSCGCSESAKKGGCDGDSDKRWFSYYLNAAVVVLIILVLWHIWKSYNELYIGTGLSDVGVYTSGATLRRLGQVFSSTDQGVQTTVYNADVCKPWSPKPCGSDVGTHVIMYPAPQGATVLTSTI